MTHQETIGRYEILEELGHGAMGTVYRAKDPSMDRVVALKTIRSDVIAGQQGSEYRERFYREARAAGALAHPGIVPVFDVGEHDGLPFLVMEFINGKTLADAARGGERLPLERVCEIGQQIAEALGYAHKNGVIHRDIKAANILLTSRESYGIERPKITDFGVAKLAAVQITTTGQMLGTPAFMPPEQFTGGAIDGRTDLFSLGVILYWMATGEYPFSGETLMSVSYKIVHTDPVPPRKLNPAVPERLDSVILKCLAKSPADRYQTGEELARDLAAVRAAGMATAIRSAASPAASLGSDPQATLNRLPSEAAQTSPLEDEPAPAPPAMATVAGTRRENRVLLGVIAALVIALGGLYVLQNRDRAGVATPTAAAPAPQASAQVPAAVASVPAAAPAPSTPPAKPPAPAARPAAVAAARALAQPAPTPAAAAPVPTPAATPTPESASVQPREAATVNFDPMALSPNENARLRIDAERVPPNSDFFVMMDGKIYMRRSTAGFKEQYDDLYVPPGVHEFRVRTRAGQLLKLSNIVSADFQAKKRLTLRIEVRLPQGRRGASLTPQQLVAAAQIFVSLR